MSVQPDSELSELSTLVLMDRAKQGDGEARDALYRRYLPRLQRWARGRLPSYARSTLETDDLVQETLLKTLARDKPFDPKHSGAFLGYVRRTVKNRIVDEIRKVGRRPVAEETASGIADKGPSPLDGLLDEEKQELYDKAFADLDLEDQAAITARLEDGLPYAKIALELGKSTPDAARMAVSRALVRLAQQMKVLGSKR